MTHVWIVEMLVKGKWQPTVGASLSRSDGQEALNDEWRKLNPHDTFRLKKYVRAT